MNLQRIIASEGTVKHAKKEDLYSIMSCIDGFDYIVELVNNEKIWKLYNGLDDRTHINISETELPLLDDSYNDIEDKDSDKPPIKIEKNKAQKLKIINDDKDEAVEKVVKKLGRPKKIIINNENNNIPVEPPNNEKQESAPKKKIIKLKEKEIDDNKKLSDYHTFIRDFLSKNSSIVWNERMKAANEAWKVEKNKINS